MKVSGGATGSRGTVNYSQGYAYQFDKLMDIRRKNGNENKIEKRLPEWFKSNVDVLMYSDKVALVSLRDLSATVIENKDIADLFRNMHELMWKSV